MKMRCRLSRRYLHDAAEFAHRASGAPVTCHIERSWRARYPQHHGYEVFLYGDGTLSRRRSAHDRDEYAATYEQWGHFINYLLRHDDQAVIGQYCGRADFDSKTNAAFPAVPAGR